VVKVDTKLLLDFEDSVGLVVAVRDIIIVLEAVWAAVLVFEGGVDLLLVTEATMLRVAATVPDVVLEFVVVAVVVGVPVSVRECRIVGETDDDAVIVFDAETLVVTVEVLRTDLLLRADPV